MASVVSTKQWPWIESQKLADYEFWLHKKIPIVIVLILSTFRLKKKRLILSNPYLQLVSDCLYLKFSGTFELETLMNW